MYFRNFGLQNTPLEKCLKRTVPEHYSTVNIRVPNTAEICTAPLLSYFLIILREIELENVSLSNI